MNDDIIVFKKGERDRIRERAGKTGDLSFLDEISQHSYVLDVVFKHFDGKIDNSRVKNFPGLFVYVQDGKFHVPTFRWHKEEVEKLKDVLVGMTLQYKGASYKLNKLVDKETYMVNEEVPQKDSNQNYVLSEEIVELAFEAEKVEEEGTDLVMSLLKSMDINKKLGREASVLTKDKDGNAGARWPHTYLKYEKNFDNMLKYLDRNN